MTPRELILADSTSLLKDDAGVAEAMCNPAPPGSRAAKRIKAVAAIITRFTPSMKTPPVDPCGSLQRSLSSVFHGVGGKGPSLSSVVDLTNRHCPMTRTFHLLRDMLASITDIAELRDGAFSGWSPEQAQALGDCLPQAGRGFVYVGYRVNAPRLRNGLDELTCVEREPLSTDARRSLVHAAYRLAFATLRQLRPELERAGDNWLELRAGEGAPRRYDIRTIEPPVESDERPAAETNDAHALSPSAKLLAWVSIDDDTGEPSSGSRHA